MPAATTTRTQTKNTKSSLTSATVNGHTVAGKPDSAIKHILSTKRVCESDPAFDNSQLGDLVPGKLPYTIEETYNAESGSAKDYLDRTEGLSVLQRHLVFFDGGLNGYIRPIDTFLGFYALNFGVVLSFIAIFVIHSGFAYPTQPTVPGAGWKNFIPSPYFRIYLGNISRDQHGCHSHSIDRRGEFQPKNFEYILNEYSSKEERDALSLSDGVKMLQGQVNILDVFGTIAFLLEWGMTYYFSRPLHVNGYVDRKILLGTINGSIFPEIAAARKKQGPYAKQFETYARNGGKVKGQ